MCHWFPAERRMPRKQGFSRGLGAGVCAGVGGEGAGWVGGDLTQRVRRTPRHDPIKGPQDTTPTTKPNNETHQRNPTTKPNNETQQRNLSTKPINETHQRNPVNEPHQKNIHKTQPSSGSQHVYFLLDKQNKIIYLYSWSSSSSSSSLWSFQSRNVTTILEAL